VANLIPQLEGGSLGEFFPSQASKIKTRCGLWGRRQLHR